MKYLFVASVALLFVAGCGKVGPKPEIPSHNYGSMSAGMDSVYSPPETVYNYIPINDADRNAALVELKAQPVAPAAVPIRATRQTRKLGKIPMPAQ